MVFIMDKIICSVVVPMYNEEEVIGVTCARLREAMDSTGVGYEILLVNDGSRDKTAEIANKICLEDPRFRMLLFSRNFGHQVAITAGMDYARGEAIVVIDADLQDPPELIGQMLEKWREGYEVVYGRRISRKGESAFKKLTSALFYRFLRGITDVDIPVDVGDFRLIDRKVRDALLKVNERNRYIRGLISWLGFNSTGVDFIREKRYAGETKYPFRKMIKFAFDAVASFSLKPLKLASYVGIFISFFSFIYLLVVIFQGIFTDSAITGWASSIAVSLFFNGVILIILGIVGEYIGRIYDEVKGRPLYIVSRTVNIGDDENEKINLR